MKGALGLYSTNNMEKKKSTKDIFDKYFEQFPEEKNRKVRPQVDRPEVYAYEEKLGKQIFDMDVDELFGLILSFNRSRELDGDGFSISYSSYEQIASLYRSIWNFYIETEVVIKNPWNNPRMRGIDAAKKIAESKKRITYTVIDDVISKINQDYVGTDYDYNKYLECLLLLFYNGFAESQEIVLLKRENINFETHEVELPGRTLHLSNRCFELLQYIHDLDKIVSSRASYAAVPYHGGYFKIAIKQKEVENFQEKSLTEVGSIITRKITMNIRQKYGVEINYRTIYLLGFYDYIVEQAGEERTHELITSIRDSDDAQELMKYAKEYGIVARNVSYVKRILRPFI